MTSDPVNLLKERGSRLFAGFERQAEMKLDQLEAATAFSDLDLPGNRLETLRGDKVGARRAVPYLCLPGNRLETFKGDRKGQNSIRINDRWRICFEWPKGSPGPVNVEIVDYH